MTGIQFAEAFRKIIQDMRGQGIAEIQIDSLILYIDQFIKANEDDVKPVDMERFKADLQILVESHKSIHASNAELFKSVIISGQNALRTAFLMNGGATIALLAFLGKLSDSHVDKIRTFSGVLIPFTVGVLAITITSGFTYLSQWFYAGTENWKRKTGLWLNVIAISLGLGSYVMFIWGVVRAYKALMSFA
jgi:hypothetical protein